MYYVRYADDWLMGVTGPKALAESLRDKAAAFLSGELKLTLSREKTLITHAKTEQAQFLGFKLSIGMAVKRRPVKLHARTTVRRVTGWHPRTEAPVHDLVNKLSKAGYCVFRNGNPFPCSKKSFVALEDHEVVMRFNAVWRGIYNFYCVSDNACKLNWVMYLLQYSCLMTLSHKRRIRVPQAIRRYGVFPKVLYRVADGKERTVQFWRPSEWQRSAPPPAETLALDVLVAKQEKATRTHLRSPCAVCGQAGQTEMHHIRALRKGNKDITSGFSRVMSAINRKQVPLCGTCHDAVHAGRYDGHKLSDLAYVPQ